MYISTVPLVLAEPVASVPSSPVTSWVRMEHSADRLMMKSAGLDTRSCSSRTTWSVFGAWSSIVLPIAAVLLAPLGFCA
jgi:hypothetical protein